MAAACEPLPISTPAAPPRRWTPLRVSLLLTLVPRILYSALAAAFSSSLTLDPAVVAQNYTEGMIDRTAHPWLHAIAGVWQRFDTINYIHIARHGYDTAWITVFYPLYPALIRIAGVVTQSDLASALLVATIATFFMFWGAMLLLELDYPRRIAVRAVVLWMVWPDAFIFFTGYPESLLIALTVWSIYFARKNNWPIAGLLACLAGLTKAAGCFVALPLLYIGWRQRDRRSLLTGIAAGLGTVVYQVWLRMAGFPPPSKIYATLWHIGTVWPWVTPIEAVRALLVQWELLLALNLFVLTATAILALSRRVPVEYRIYTAVVVLLFLTRRTDPPFQSNMRYSLCLFAAFPTLAQRIEDNLGFAGAAVILALLNLLLFRVFLDWSLVV